jgi:hypothetical protein
VVQDVVAEDRVVGPVRRGQRRRVAALDLDPPVQVTYRLPARRHACVVPLDAVSACGAEDLEGQTQTRATAPGAQFEHPAPGHLPAQLQQDGCLDTALDQRADARVDPEPVGVDVRRRDGAGGPVVTHRAVVPRQRGT